MIRITSNLGFDMKVPHPTVRGAKPKFFTVKGAKDGVPGVTELDELDTHTMARLRWHYDWRPTDPKNADKERSALRADEIAIIGLLKIEVSDEDGNFPEPVADDAEAEEDPKASKKKPRAKAA